MEEWVQYECEACKRKFAVMDDLEEPSCPECHESNCAEIG